MQANTSTANVLRSSSAQSTRGVLCLLGSFLVAASSATLAFSPAWGNVLFRRNFAVLSLGAGGKGGWDPDQNLRVRYYAEGLERPIEQTLLAL